eukprot:COSAG01_NODE_3335_length_6237_cov_5.928315_7_plen_162_part_00
MLEQGHLEHGGPARADQIIVLFEKRPGSEDENDVRIVLWTAKRAAATKQFFVLSDSSTRAGGVCLGQRDDETGKLYAVGYASKVWSDTQAKYTCTELELLLAGVSLSAMITCAALARHQTQQEAQPNPAQRSCGARKWLRTACCDDDASPAAAVVPGRCCR